VHGKASRYSNLLLLVLVVIVGRPQKSCHALTSEQRWYSFLSRRHLLVSLISTVPSISVALEECQNGALVAEQAVPGAYQQVCMDLNVRSIPLVASQTLEIQQGGAAAGTTGLAVWNSSLLLARLLQRLKNDADWLNDKTVLELGCGTGMVSLVAALLGASNVIATDGNPSVVELATKNIQANDLSKQIVAQQLSWGLLDAMEFSEHADLVLGSDLTYNAGSWRVLAESMAAIVKPNGYILYLSLGHAGFNVNAEIDGFLSVAREQGLVLTQPSDEEWPFPKIRTPLTELLLTDCVAMTERGVVEATGGVRVLLLHKKSRRKSIG